MRIKDEYHERLQKESVKNNPTHRNSATEAEAVQDLKEHCRAMNALDSMTLQQLRTALRRSRIEEAKRIAAEIIPAITCWLGLIIVTFAIPIAVYNWTGARTKCVDGDCEYGISNLWAMVAWYAGTIVFFVSVHFLSKR